MSDKQNRFVNYPINMLAETIADPKRGLNAIACFAFAEYAKHCGRDFPAAFAQTLYLATRGRKTIFPDVVLVFLERNDVRALAEVTETLWAEGDADFASNAADAVKDALAGGLAITDRERQAVIEFVALRDAAKFFGRILTDYDAVTQTAARSRQAVSEHESRHGKSVFASVPADYFFETHDGNPTADDLRVFRCVAAARSLVGKKHFVGVTKDMLRARMIGGKSPSVAASLAQGAPELKAELDELQSRKRFDRLLTLAASRGFFGKFGKGRRIYLSTEDKDPVALAGRVRTRFDRLTEYRERERTARAAEKRVGNVTETLLKRYP